MDRRNFMKKASASSAGVVAVLSGCLSESDSEPTEDTAGPGDETPTSSGGRISELAFYSPASQVSAEGGSLGGEHSVVRAEETGYSIDTTDSNPYMYEEGEEPPLVSEDGGVVGFGSTELVSDTNGGFNLGNEEFLLNIWDAKVSGDRIVWDEGHDQYWSLNKYSVFQEYAEGVGYEISTTTSLASDVSEADAVVLTSPSSALTQEELGALAKFVEGGGALFLHDQSDFQGNDETGNLNEIAEALDLGFRFNSDQVNDDENNSNGGEFIPVTSNFEGPSEYFRERESSVEPEGADVEQGEEYEVTVVGVEDGDTADVAFDDGTVETVRFLGMDTPEVEGVDERLAEWPGIDERDPLLDWADQASEFPKERIENEDVTLVFDEVEPVRGEYGRLLAYIRHEGSNVSLSMVEQGYARLYSSGFGKHDQFARAEQEAIENGRGLWENSDIDAMSEFRNSDVGELFFPHPVSVEGDAVVSAEDTAEPPGSPLAAVDEEAGVTALGGAIMEESYEQQEDFSVDTSGYGNYTFLTNLAYRLSDRDGDVFFEGGHRQFSTEGSLSKEDAAYYGRHLEGFGRRLRQLNDVSETLPEVDASALIISPPSSEYTEEELGAVREFVNSGGSLILVGDSRSEHLGKLNEIANAVDADVGFNDTGVEDATNNVAGEPEILETTNFDTSEDLFGEFDGV